MLAMQMFWAHPARAVCHESPHNPSAVLGQWYPGHRCEENCRSAPRNACVKLRAAAEGQNHQVFKFRNANHTNYHGDHLSQQPSAAALMKTANIKKKTTSDQVSLIVSLLLPRWQLLRHGFSLSL